jgi:hypothetical protein
MGDHGPANGLSVCRRFKFRHDATGRHHADTVGKFKDLVKILADQEDRSALGG